MTIRVLPGPSFARGTPRRRTGIGLGAALLTQETSLVVDADACMLDGAPVTDWWRVVRADDLGRVDGAFVIAWRTARGVCLARDPIGHRTLYYAVANGELLFASSLRALLDSGALPRRVNLRSLSAYLAYAYIPGRETMVEGAFELLPGEILAYEQGVLKRRSYWQIPDEKAEYDPEPVLERRLRTGLEERIGTMLPGGASVAASLSGGIDSSLVVALAQRLSPKPIQTFSITFGPEHRDELAFSGLVAEHVGTKHTVVELTSAAILAHLDDTIACLDKPNGDPLTVPNALLFREMSERADVALNGEGGDPCFGGPKNVPMVLAEIYGDTYDGPPEKRRERSYLRAHAKCSDELDLALAQHVLDAVNPPLEDDLAPWFQSPRWTTLVTRLLALNVTWKGGHHILPKVAALSAPFGVRARSPLFDRSLVLLAFAIPPQLKLQGAVEKYLLKRAVRDLLPSAILERPKSGMMVPVEGWFSGPFLAEARARIQGGLARRGLFQPRYLADLLDGKRGGLRPRRGAKIWLLVTLESHLRSLGLT
jgi:asparagine synthase (glutamine-hydrolysing)